MPLPMLRGSPLEPCKKNRNAATVDGNFRTQSRFSLQLLAFLVPAQEALQLLLKLRLNSIVL